MDMNFLLSGILFGVYSSWIHRAGRRGGQVSLSDTIFRPLACQVLSPTSCQKVTLALEDISADYAGYEGRSEMQGKVRYGTTLDFLDRVLHVFAYGDSWHFTGNELRTVQAGGCMPPVQ